MEGCARTAPLKTGYACITVVKASFPCSKTDAQCDVKVVNGEMETTTTTTTTTTNYYYYYYY
jgi:hypothetical protein